MSEKRDEFGEKERRIVSYDFSITVDTGGNEPHYIEPYFADEHPALGGDNAAGVVSVTAQGYARCGNYTSNVSPMWTRCLNGARAAFTGAAAQAYDQLCGEDDRRMRDTYESQRDRPIDRKNLYLRDLHGQPARLLAPLLAAAVEWGVEHIDELHEFDPENGWGNANGAVEFLWDIQRMCEQHPEGRLYISS